MVLQKISKLRKGQEGFTIVELLIVIVVIGILAAITIVAYTGITAKARLSNAQQSASTVQAAADAFNAGNGGYPTKQSDLISGTDSVNTGTATTTPTVLPSAISFTTAGTGWATGTGVVGSSLTATNLGLSASSTQNTIAYGFTLGGATAAANTNKATGGVIFYWNPSTAAISTPTYVGGAKSTDTFYPLY